MEDQEFNQTRLMRNQSIAPTVPFMSKEKFSELTGYSIGTIKGWMNKGLIPVFPKLGKHTPINLVELHHEASITLRNKSIGE